VSAPSTPPWNAILVQLATTANALEARAAEFIARLASHDSERQALLHTLRAAGQVLTAREADRQDAEQWRRHMASEARVDNATQLPVRYYAGGRPGRHAQPPTLTALTPEQATAFGTVAAALSPWDTPRPDYAHDKLRGAQPIDTGRSE